MGQRDIGSSIANPDREASVQKAWEGLAHSDGPIRNVRMAVASSWRRCVEARVNLDLKQAPEPLNEAEFSKLREANAELLEASENTIEMAKEILAKSGAAMMLTDKNGVILNIVGDNRALNVLEKINMLHGACWSERECGTNAIGTAISSGMPIQIHGSEHYCESIKRFTCSASVISDPIIGQALGTINISGFTGTYSPQSLGLVLNAAHRIKEALEYKILSNRYKIIHNCDANPLSSNRDELLLLDYRGMPFKIGAKAKKELCSAGVALDEPQAFSLLTEYLTKPNQSTKSSLPAWVQPEWIEAIYDKKELLGWIIRLTSDKFNARATTKLETHHHDVQAFSGAVGESDSLKHAIEKSCKVAKSNAPVLLLGETGSGKEIFASEIHKLAKGENSPFVALNCGALNRDLLASELFGYVEGAFTGARRGGMRGKIEAADGGTLFLDEIGEMPLDIQPAFLRVLEEREVMSLGSIRPKKVSFRLICATNRNIKNEIEQGRFRLDLYYRISVVAINIPPLRERVGDPALLANHFLKLFCNVHQIPQMKFSSNAIQRLNSYSWPGNVRELRNVIESLVLATPGTIIGRSEVDAELTADANDYSTSDLGYIAGGLARGEYEQIKKALQRTEGNATRAAKELGIAKSTLYLKVKKLNLERFLDLQRSHPK